MHQYSGGQSLCPEHVSRGVRAVSPVCRKRCEDRASTSKLSAYKQSEQAKVLAEGSWPESRKETCSIKWGTNYLE